MARQRLRDNSKPNCQGTLSRTLTYLGCTGIDARYLWRPNLKDEADNHLVELAIAARASYIITKNVSDFAQAELKRLGYDVVTPEQILRLLRS